MYIHRTSKCNKYQNYMNFKSIVSILVIIVISACTNPSDKASQVITAESLLEPIEILSSDDFEGRAPATRGEDLTVEYLVSEFEKAGLEPGMPDGSFVQDFPLLGMNVDRGSAMISLKKDGNRVEELEYFTEFMAWPSNEEEAVEIRDAELVYVGYGIQAPEFDWDDYKGADVEGKILVFKNDDPKNDPDIFAGNARLYYGRWSYKYEIAQELGALGAVIIHTTPTAGYPWLVVSNSWGRERFSLKSSGESGDGITVFNGWLTQESSRNLFDLAGLSFREQLDSAENRDFSPVPLEGVTMDVNLNAEYSDMVSRNVLGKIEGNDPDLKEEYLVFTAHHDHLGVTFPVEGDSINNGALDNAAGISAMLNLAKTYKQVEPDMRRSALFLAVGAEEMGLLGSQYWAANPTIHPGKITANINLDGMQVYGPTEDVVLVGYDRNTVSDVIEEVAERNGRIVKPDPSPEQGFFYRSDHFSLAKIGVPAIFPNPGRDYIGKPDDYNETVDSLRNVNYHSVSDEINEFWDLGGMERDVRLFFEAGLEILNADEKMSWREGDEFEAARKQMLEEAGN